VPGKVIEVAHEVREGEGRTVAEGEQPGERAIPCLDEPQLDRALRGAVVLRDVGAGDRRLDAAPVSRGFFTFIEKGTENF